MISAVAPIPAATSGCADAPIGGGGISARSLPIVASVLTPEPLPTSDPVSASNVAVAEFVALASTDSEPALEMSPSICALVPPSTLAVAPNSVTEMPTAPALPGVEAVAVFTDSASTITALLTNVISDVSVTMASTSAS